MTTPRPGRKEHSYTSAPHGVTHERFDNETKTARTGRQSRLPEGDRRGPLGVDPRIVGEAGTSRQGGATALLEAVVAHYPGRVLALSAEPITMTNHEPAGPSADQLAAWYTRQRLQRDSGHRMTRLPGDHRASVAGDPAAPKVAATSASAAGMAYPAQERERRFAAADSLARHGIHVRSDGPLSSEDVDTTRDLDHTMEATRASRCTPSRTI